MKILLQSHWHPIDGDFYGVFYGLHDLEILIKVKCYISRIKHKSTVKVCTFTGKVTDWIPGWKLTQILWGLQEGRLV